MKTRIKNALRWRKPRMWVTVLAAVLCIAAVAACTANPKENTEPTATAAPAEETGTPWDWSHSVKASDIREAALKNAATQQEITLTRAQVEEVTALLNAVPGEKVLQGRGIPSEKVLYLRDTGYAMRFAGGIIELDTPVPNADTEYGPVVWEIHDESLYNWLDTLWSETMGNTEPGNTEPGNPEALPLVPVDLAQDTVAFTLRDGSLTLAGSGREQTYEDVLKQIPFGSVSYRIEDNFLRLESLALPAYGVLTPGQSIISTSMAIYGVSYPERMEDQELLAKMMTAPQLTLHTEEEGSDYFASGIFAGMDFALALDYEQADRIREPLTSITLRFLPNEGIDHAFDMYARLRSALVAQLGTAGLEENLGASEQDMVPGTAIRSYWSDGSNVLQLALEIGDYYDRSLTVRLYASPDSTAYPSVETDGLSKMASLTAKDITGVFSAGWMKTDAETLAPLMSAAAAHPTAEPEVESNLKFWWWVEVYLAGGPDIFSSRDEHYDLCAQQTENLVYVRYWDGKHEYGGTEEYWVEDAALYNLVRGCFRSDGVVEAEAWEKYGVYLEARAQETIDHYEPYGAGGLSGFDVTRLEKTAYSWRSEDGEYLPVYAWQVAFYPEDVNNVGWAGGMTLDADNRVTGIENDTYFAVREGPSGPELTFLPYDTYFRWEGGHYDNWREAYRALFENVLLKEREYTGTAGWPVTGVTLADLSGSGVPELIVFLPGASVSGAAVVITFEEGEARAFNAESDFGLPLARNAVESGFWANQTVYDDDDAGFRSSGSGWYLNSSNAAWPAEAWCDWFRFGADRNGFLTCDLLYSLSVQGEESFGGVYTETGWRLNGEEVSREAYHEAEAAIEEWRRSLDDFQWTAISLPFREHGELLPPDDLTERFNDLLDAWQTSY